MLVSVANAARRLASSSDESCEKIGISVSRLGSMVVADVAIPQLARLTRAHAYSA